MISTSIPPNLEEATLCFFLAWHGNLTGSEGGYVFGCLIYLPSSDALPMLKASLEQLRNDQKMTQSLISHYRAQHMAQICLCLKKALDAPASEAVDQLKRAIASFGRINESGAYFEEIRQLQSGVQTIINREKLIRQYNEERLEVCIKAAARKMRSCAVFPDAETGRKHPSQMSGFSSDGAHQQLYMNLLTIPDYLDAVNLLAVCRKIYVLDSCVFSAFTLPFQRLSYYRTPPLYTY